MASKSPSRTARNSLCAGSSVTVAARKRSGIASPSNSRSIRRCFMFVLRVVGYWFLRQRCDPTEKISHIFVEGCERGGVVPGAAQPSRLIGQVAVCKQSTHPETELV